MWLRLEHDPIASWDYLAYAPGIFRRTKSVSEPTYQLLMTAAHRAHADRNGLMTLSSLAQDTSCDYEQKVAPEFTNMVERAIRLIPLTSSFK